jgi:hypothetical protein
MQVLRRMDERTDRFPFSSFDYAAGSAEATRHLIATGARASPSSAVSTNAITQERMSGISPRWPEAGLPPLRLEGPTSRDFGRSVATRLRRDHPDCDAVVCFNDLVALGPDRRACSATGSPSGGTSASSASTISRRRRWPGRTSPRSPAISPGSVRTRRARSGLAGQPARGRRRNGRAKVRLVRAPRAGGSDAMTPKALLRAMFDAAVAVADPMRSLAVLSPPKPPGRVVVIGAGKASARMAEAVEAAWGPCEGL